jgi:hypothetical protein
VYESDALIRNATNPIIWVGILTQIGCIDRQVGTFRNHQEKSSSFVTDEMTGKKNITPPVKNPQISECEIKHLERERESKKKQDICAHRRMLFFSCLC